MNSNLIANKKTIQFLVILILGVALGLRQYPPPERVSRAITLVIW